MQRLQLWQRSKILHILKHDAADLAVLDRHCGSVQQQTVLLVCLTAMPSRS